jgi:hypothetical protein
MWIDPKCLANSDMCPAYKSGQLHRFYCIYIIKSLEDSHFSIGIVLIKAQVGRNEGEIDYRQLGVFPKKICFVVFDFCDAIPYCRA